VVVGVKVVPWFLDRLASLHSRELFVLATAALALGAAYVSTFFGLSLALGAIAAGIIVGESDLSHRILGEVTPLRDIFAGMFFVSIGMLANPGYVISNPGIVLVALALIVLVKSTLSAAITLLAKVRTRTGLLAGASLGQSAEFSFVLAQVGAGLGVVGSDLFTLMVTAAAGSIVAVPYLVGVASKLSARSESALVPDPELASSANALRDHAVICGFGRVGRVIGEGLAEDGYPFLVIDQDQSVIRELREQGTPAIAGPAESAAVLEHAGLANARVVVVALPDALAVRQVVDYCHRLYPDLPIVARTHSDRELEYLQGRGITAAVMSERELAAEMARCTLRCLISEPETDHQERATQPEAPAGD
jgi:CPA2 family monovalent cation:H+ antiporter-2